MATVYPSSPVGSLPKEVLKMFNFLKKLADDYHVWHRLVPYSPGSPDFLVLNPKGKAALIKVSLASANARPGQLLLLASDGAAPLGEVETLALTEFTQGLEPDVAAKISKVVVFANVAREALQAALPPGQSAVRWVSKEFLETGDPSRWAAIFKQPALDGRERDRLRGCFCPEVVVPAAISVRTQTHANLPDGDFLLDLDQEWAIKSELDLPSEQKQLSKSMNLRIVNGAKYFT